jgi:hypothetical protein
MMPEKSGFGRGYGTNRRSMAGTMKKVRIRGRVGKERVASQEAG